MNDNPSCFKPASVVPTANGGPMKQASNCLAIAIGRVTISDLPCSSSRANSYRQVSLG